MRPKAERQAARTFAASEEIRHYLAAVRGGRLEGLFGVALALGPRQGEAPSLRWSAIHLAFQLDESVFPQLPFRTKTD